MKLMLYHFPGACSRVTMKALIKAGAEFDDCMVNLMAGEHFKADYKAANPRGKVPALLVDGRLLSENAAILTWIDATYPDAGLLPRAADDWQRAQILSDLFWLSSVWHPCVRANKMPIRWTTGDVAPVRERGKELLTPCIEQLEERLEGQDWWYGEWSIIDHYFHWAYTTAAEGEFDLSPYPNIHRHRMAVEQSEPYIRAREREEQAKLSHGLKA